MGMIAGLAPISAAQLQALREAPESVGDFVHTQDEARRARRIDLDKAWHGLHYLLTGKAWGGEKPASLAIVGGEDIGDDQGYGPARFVTPEQVGQVAAALASLSDETLAQRYDVAAMDKLQIYPGTWERDGQESFDYLRHNFRALARFYADAAQRGDAVLQWIS